MAVSTMILLGILIKGRLRRRSSVAVTQVTIGVSLVLVYILSGGILSGLIHSTFDLVRFTQSLISISFCLISAYYFSIVVCSCKKEQANKAFRFVFMAIMFSSVPMILGIHLSGGESSHTAFFYNERSHYALGLAPFLLYQVVLDTKRRWIWVIFAVMVALTVKSLTLIIVVLLIFAVIMPISVTIIFTIFIVASVLGVGDQFLYYIDRAALSSESSNFSNLVYLSGWERAWLSMNETLGFGYGLNQLGIVGNPGTIMSTLSELNAEGLNALDGSTVASKLIAEFGVVGVLMLLIYVRLFLKGVRFVRSAMNKISEVSRIELFFWSCMITYSLDLFIRGAGYFSAESFMFFGALWGLARLARKRNGNFVEIGGLGSDFERLHKEEKVVKYSMLCK